jgi:hypothetical protein
LVPKFLEWFLLTTEAFGERKKKSKMDKSVPLELLFMV